MTDSENRPASARHRLLTASAVLVALAIVAAGAGLVWFFGRSAPEKADLEAAVAGVVTTTSSAVAPETAATTPSGATSTAAPSTILTPAPALDGTWSVDPTVGSFSFEEATATFVGFRIQEELRGLGSATAVGRTPEVAGTLTLEGDTITSTTVEADLTSLITNDSRRDDRVQGALETDAFPTATFTLTEPIPLGSEPADGETVETTAVGELTVHGVTQPVTMPIEAQLVDDLIIVVGSFEIVFADFGVSVPSAPIVLSAEDHGIVEVQLWFSRP